jgi:hypothetical protein
MKPFKLFINLIYTTLPKTSFDQREGAEKTGRYLENKQKIFDWKIRRKNSQQFRRHLLAVLLVLYAPWARDFAGRICNPKKTGNVQVRNNILHQVITTNYYKLLSGPVTPSCVKNLSYHRPNNTILQRPISLSLSLHGIIRNS